MTGGAEASFVEERGAREKRKAETAPARKKEMEQVRKEVSHSGIFQYIGNNKNFQNLVLVKTKLTPEQERILKERHAKNVEQEKKK